MPRVYFSLKCIEFLICVPSLMSKSIQYFSNDCIIMKRTFYLIYININYTVILSTRCASAQMAYLYMSWRTVFNMGYFIFQLS